MCASQRGSTAWELTLECLAVEMHAQSWVCEGRAHFTPPDYAPVS